MNDTIASGTPGVGGSFSQAPDGSLIRTGGTAPVNRTSTLAKGMDVPVAPAAETKAEADEA